MLPSLRSRLSVGLSATRVEIVRTRQGWHAAKSAPVILSVAQSKSDTTWQAALAIMEAWLVENHIRRAEFDVVVTDSFVRYVVIPWSDGIEKPSEVQMLAQLQFEELFGAVSSDWEIVVDMPTYGKAGVACGIESDFRQALQTLCGQYDCRMRTLQPNFMRLFNQARLNIADDAILVAADEGSCVLACLRGREWISVRALRTHGAMEDWLPVLGEREGLLQGLDAESPIQLLTPDAFDSAWLRQHPRIMRLSNDDASQARGGMKGS